MEFCPSCGTLLQIDPGTGSHRLRFFCPICPYVCGIQNKIVRKAKLVKKEVEPIFSGDDAMKLAPQTEATCPRCGHGKAYFQQRQLRSADEPMTIFYMCCECSYNWKED
ncbi:hypothetical protein QOZ80_2AG0140550 [Eleusine coracana subsp. coracana]|nr:hypothetical protein QOZ80_2BG0196190 [Eleusine coracana subsp. coracana]KAK3158707.1 hypothetical protein QOZ80_2AG0140550 [Eleusine coracana subsp. coracana]